MVAGSINLGAPVVVRVQRVGSDTRLEGIVALMRDAMSQRPSLTRGAAGCGCVSSSWPGEQEAATGIPATEGQAVKSRADYADYQREVSVFVPWFPKKPRQ